MALTGFLVNTGTTSICADGSANAIQALGARFPYVAGNQPVLCNIESSVFTAPDLFVNTVKCHDLTGTQWYQYSHDLRLMMCDPTLPIAGVVQGGVFDYVYAASLWSMAFTFVLALYLVSRSAGVILNFIRGRG